MLITKTRKDENSNDAMGNFEIGQICSSFRCLFFAFSSFRVFVIIQQRCQDARVSGCRRFEMESDDGAMQCEDGLKSVLPRGERKAEMGAAGQRAPVQSLLPFRSENAVGAIPVSYD